MSNNNEILMDERYSEGDYIIVMKLQLHLEMKLMRCMRGIMQTILKLCYAKDKEPRCYLIYIIDQKEVRLLIDNISCAFIFAFDSKAFCHDNSSFNSQSHIFGVQILGGRTFFIGILNFIDCVTASESVKLFLTKDKAEENKQPLRYLNMECLELKLKVQVAKPTYDELFLSAHQWLSGCGSIQSTKVTFLLDTQHLLNALRIFVRNNEYYRKERIIKFFLYFQRKIFHLSFENMESIFQGEIKDANFSSRKYQADFQFVIHSVQIPNLFEAIDKLSQIKLIITSKNTLVLCFNKETAYQSQLLIREWVTFRRLWAHHGQGLKLQQL